MYRTVHSFPAFEVAMCSTADLSAWHFSYSLSRYATCLARIHIRYHVLSHCTTRKWAVLMFLCHVSSFYALPCLRRKTFVTTRSVCAFSCSSAPVVSSTGTCRSCRRSSATSRPRMLTWNSTRCWRGYTKWRAACNCFPVMFGHALFYHLL